MTLSSLILAIDAGSLSMRCTLFAEDGGLVASSARRLTSTIPAQDRHEQDANEIWQALLEALAELAASNDLARVVAVGLTNQRGTCLLWDRMSGEPLGPAIFWSDRRTEPFIAALRESGHELLVQVTTGVALHNFYSAPKLRWMLDNLPGAGGLLAVGQLAGGTLDSWLLWKLTGGRIHATDYSNAQRTMLLNLTTLAWDSELARLFSVAPEILPEAGSGARKRGATDIASLPQLRAPIGAVAADQTAALLGHGAVAPGEAKCSYGSSVVPLMFCGPRPIGAREGLAAIAYDAGGKPAYGIGYTIAGGALALDWCCTRLGAFASVKELVAQAAKAPPDDSVVFVPAFAGTPASARDATDRAAILGLHATADRRSIARAALESIAFQVADALALMRKVSGVALTRLRVDGGLARSDLLMQMQADLLGIAVERPAQSELASLGIAYLAAMGAGLTVAPDFLANGRGKARVFTPQLDGAGRERRMALWHSGVERAGGWMKTQAAK
jgi:glycerol kinase